MSNAERVGEWEGGREREAGKREVASERKRGSEV